MVNRVDLVGVAGEGASRLPKRAFGVQIRGQICPPRDQIPQLWIPFLLGTEVYPVDNQSLKIRRENQDARP